MYFNIFFRPFIIPFIKKPLAVSASIVKCFCLNNYQTISKHFKLFEHFLVWFGLFKCLYCFLSCLFFKTITLFRNLNPSFIAVDQQGSSTPN